MDLSETELRERIYGGLLGKAIGGTLGMPFEGYRGTVDLSYYDPVPSGMVANDDLDMQVVYTWLLDRMDKPRVDRHVLSDAWQYMLARCDEYGIVKRNLDLGLVPPATGQYDNWFYGGMGAAIRTEIWACLAPGNPAVAAAYAYEDACMDHRDEGIDAAVFLAVLESLAFVKRDAKTLILEALAFIPATSQVHQAIELTVELFGHGLGWVEIRKQVLARFGNDNFTWVPPNLAFIVLGLLEWQRTGDFGRALCVAVGCGEDADCTGATLGSILGILSPAEIPVVWRKPIGQEVVLSSSVVGITPPATLDGLTDQIISIRKRLNGKTSSPDAIPSPAPKPGIQAWTCQLPWKNAFPPYTAPPEIDAARRQHCVFPGNWVQLPRETLKHDMLVVGYPLQFRRSVDTLVMVSSRHWQRVWVDGQLLLARDCGEMVPAYHRSPIHQMAGFTFSAGKHEMITAFMPQPDCAQVEWVAGLAGKPARGRCFEEWLIGDGFIRASEQG